MTSFPREENRVPVIGGVSSIDLLTPTTIAVDPTTHEVKTSISSDIQIGAVEIKNATDDTRAVVDSDGLNVSVKKSVLPTGAATAVAQATNEDSNTLLRRLVKLLESQAIVDSANRQRVAIDSVTGVISTMGVSLAAGPNSPTIAAPVMPGSAVYWQPIWEGPVDQRWRVIDAARLSYNLGIRNQLSFT
jgi:hypothetical protein